MLGDCPPTRLLIRSAAAIALAVVAATGCAGFRGFPSRGTTALSFLRTIEESKDPNVRFAAYDSLSRPQCYDNDEQMAKAAQTMVAKLHGTSEPVATRAVICRTLGLLGRPEARAAVLAATNDEDPLVRAEACRALGKVGQPEDATVLARVMAIDGSPECKIAAVESLGVLKAPDRRINEMLVAGMEDKDPSIRVASMKALEKITGKDLGVDPLAWKKYVESLYPPAKPTDTPVEGPPAANAGLRDLPPGLR